MQRKAWKVGRWTFLPELHLLRWNGVERHLEPKQTDLLARLCDEAGSVVSKAELLDTIWADVCVTDEVLTNSIYQLRKALGDSARTQRYIQTIPKKGYRLVVDVTPRGESRSGRKFANLVSGSAIVALLMILIVARTGGDEESRRVLRLLERGEVALAAGGAAPEGEALRLFEEATIVKPDSARAWSGLAASRWALLSSGELSVRLGAPLVEHAARRAIALDPTEDRAWRTIGLAHAARWEWEKAENALVRAIHLDPSSARSHGTFAEILLLMGRTEQARTEISKALELGPDSRDVLSSAGFIYTMLRDTEAAARAYRAILALKPEDHEAQRQLAKLHGSTPFAGDSEITLDEVDQLLKKRPLRPAIIAGMFAEAGEDDKAMEWLRRARDEKDISLLLVRLDDRWTRLHGDPRLRSMLDEVGLSPR